MMWATRRRGTRRAVYRWAVVVYDRFYRLAHGLDRSPTEVGGALRIEVRRSLRARRLTDGTVVGRGDRIGILHLNNDRIRALHGNGLSPAAVGLECRRQVLESLHTLAVLATPSGRLADVRAFVATTIFWRGLARLGFEVEPDGLVWPRLVAAYQRALLASLRPAGPLRLRRLAYQRAHRLWISREALLTRYGTPPSGAGEGAGARPRGSP